MRPETISAPTQHSAADRAAETSGMLKWRKPLRYMFATSVPALVILYVAGILEGTFVGQRRLNPSDTIIVVVTAVALFAALWPEVLDRLNKVKLGAVEFELLQHLDERQRKQQRDLDDIRFILTLLLPPSERKHLENLENGNTANYIGNRNLQAELRRLRTLQLIENMLPIGDIPEGTKFDLEKFVRLTEAGHRYLTRLALDQ
jgi:hypothetical protein